MTSKRAGARWIALLCALGAIPLLVVAGAREGIRFVRESRAIAALQSKDEGERKAALRELATLQSAQGVLAILSTLSSDQKVARAVNLQKSDPWDDICARTILDMGSVAIPMLRRTLRSPDAAERFWSVYLLLRFSDKGRQEPAPELYALLDESLPIDVLKILGTLLRDGNEGVRTSARTYLNRPEAVPVLLEVLAGGNPVESPLALEILEVLGPKARKAVPALVGVARGEDPELAARAIEALAVISPDDGLPLSIEALGHESRGVRNAARTALWTVGSAASSAIPALRRLIEEEEDLDLATRATTLVRRLEYEQSRTPRVRR